MTAVLTRVYSTDALVARPLVADLVPAVVHRRLNRADVGHDQLLGGLVCVAGAPAVGIAAAALFNPWIGLGLSIALLGLPLVLLLRWSGRRNERLAAELPVVVDAISRSVRSGASLSQAVREMAENGPRLAQLDFVDLVANLERGHSLPSALEIWARGCDDRAEVRMVAATLSFVAENEAGSGRALDGLGETLRGRHRLDAELRALTAQAAASLQALVLLPVAFLVFDAFTGQGALMYLGTQSLGRACLAGGLLLELIGAFWMHRLVRSRMP